MPAETLFSRSRAREAKAAVILKYARRPAVRRGTRFAIATTGGQRGRQAAPGERHPARRRYRRVPCRIGQRFDWVAQPRPTLGAAARPRKSCATLEPVLGAERRARQRAMWRSTPSSERRTPTKSYDPKSDRSHADPTAIRTKMPAAPRRAECPAPPAMLQAAGAASSATAARICPGSASPRKARRANTLRRQQAAFVTPCSPPGRLRRIAAAVLVDDATQTPADGAAGSKTGRVRERTPEEIEAASSNWQPRRSAWTRSRGDALAVENLTFQQTARGACQLSLRQASRGPGRMLVQWSGLLRYAGIDGCCSWSCTSRSCGRSRSS